MADQQNKGISVAAWATDLRLAIRAVIDGVEIFVPNDPNNTDRQRIKRDWEDKGRAIGDPPPPPAPAPVPRPSR
jgi:hypothetical protein